MSTPPLKNVLVIGSGAREHALAWKLEKSPQVGKIFVAPGNDGMPERWQRVIAPDFEALAKLALEEKIDLTVVGPDNALAEGIVDIFSREGLLVFGPMRDAAQIESSKAFSKEIMKAARVPTAEFHIAHSEQDALECLKAPGFKNGCVVKADGLALGKGVRVCASREEAEKAIRELITINGTLVIEEKLAGAELSWMAFCDGERCALLEPARDYKRLSDSDQGPNTGGMGAFSPVAGIPKSYFEKMRREVFLPTLQELSKRGMPFRGVLYAGLMVSPNYDKYWVLELNARFGDPETQVLMPRLKGDFYEWCEGSARGDLRGLPEIVPFSEDCAICVVGAAEGYPDNPKRGAAIEGMLPGDHDNDGGFFYAGVKKEGASLKTSGGRVLGALGVGASLALARDKAYAKIRRVHWDGIQFRNDIGMIS
jgi:phosphoribosylamine--glycine ligase